MFFRCKGIQKTVRKKMEIPILQGGNPYDKIGISLLRMNPEQLRGRQQRLADKRMADCRDRQSIILIVPSRREGYNAHVLGMSLIIVLLGSHTGFNHIHDIIA